MKGVGRHRVRGPRTPGGTPGLRPWALVCCAPSGPRVSSGPKRQTRLLRIPNACGAGGGGGAARRVSALPEHRHTHEALGAGRRRRRNRPTLSPPVFGPALGYPTRPISAIDFSSNTIPLVPPGSPKVRIRGARRSPRLKCRFPCGRRSDAQSWGAPPGLRLGRPGMGAAGFTLRPCQASPEATPTHGSMLPCRHPALHAIAGGSTARSVTWIPKTKSSRRRPSGQGCKGGPGGGGGRGIGRGGEGEGAS